MKHQEPLVNQLDLLKKARLTMHSYFQSQNRLKKQRKHDKQLGMINSSKSKSQPEFQGNNFGFAVRSLSRAFIGGRE